MATPFKEVAAIFHLLSPLATLAFIERGEWGAFSDNLQAKCILGTLKSCEARKVKLGTEVNIC